MPKFTPKVELEIGQGTNNWFDVTADVDLSPGGNGIATQYGRTSEFSDVQVATCSFTLHNPKGQYTVGQQYLNDGVTANPLYNVLIPRMRVRVREMSTGGGFRFFGYINQIQPGMENGTRPIVTLSAVDGQDILSKRMLRAAYLEAQLASKPIYYWPFDNRGGALIGQDILHNRNDKANTRLIQAPGMTKPVYSTGNQGNPVQASDGTRCLAINGGGQIQFNIQPNTITTALTLEFWMGLGGPASGLTGTDAQLTTTVSLYSGSTYFQYTNAYDRGESGHTAYGNATYTYSDVHNSYTQEAAVSTPDQLDVTGKGGGAHVVMILKVVGSGLVMDFWMDGVFHTGPWDCGASAGGYGPPQFGSQGGQLYIDCTNMMATGGWCYLSGLALYDRELTTAEILDHANTGYANQLQSTATYLEDYMNYAGIGSGASRAIDYTGDGAVGGSPFLEDPSINGQPMLQVMQNLLPTESGGSVLWVKPNGTWASWSRWHRAKTYTPDITFDAVKDLSRDTWAPSLDSLNLVTESTVTDPDGNVYAFIDASAAAKFGTIAESVDVQSIAPDGNDIAAYRVRAQSTPQMRLAQVAVDFVTAETSGLMLALSTKVDIGSRIRIANIPAGTLAGSTLDLWVEGYSEKITIDSWVTTFDTSPVGAPGMLWGPVTDPAAPSAAGADDMKLSTAITATNTVVQVIRPTPWDGLHFTMDSTQYPMDIVIQSEQMTVTGPPTTLPSASHLTNDLPVIRGVAGTTAVSHGANAVVKLANQGTFVI